MQRSLISSYVLPAIKQRINAYFFKAERLVSKEEALDLTRANDAMDSIICGCTKREDVIQKKIEFYQVLTGNDIEDYNETYSSAHEYSLESPELLNSFTAVGQKTYTEDEVSSCFATLSRVHWLRRDSNQSSYENAKYYYVSHASLAWAIATCPGVKYQTNDVPLVTSIDFLTERLWFALNKGFSKATLPSSFDMVAKAKAALSAKLSNEIHSKYNDYTTNNTYPPEIQKTMYMELKDRVNKFNPDNLSASTVQEIIEFYTEEEKEKYFFEKEEFKQKAEQLEHKKQELEEEIAVRTKRESQLKQDSLKKEEELEHKTQKLEEEIASRSLKEKQLNDNNQFLCDEEFKKWQTKDNYLILLKTLMTSMLSG